jgi:opacity protein-like surface antigen
MDEMNRAAWISIVSGSLTSIAAAPVLPAETGFYLSAGAGHAEENPGKSSGLNVSTGFPFNEIQHIDPDRVDADESDVAWSVAAGYRFNPHVAAEVAYLDFGTTDFSEHYRFSASSVVFLPIELTRTYSSKVTGPALSVLGSLPVGRGFDVFLRAGVLFADRKVEVAQSVGLGKTTFGSTVWMGGAGVDWSFASRWAVRAEYQRTGNLDATFLAGETDLERVSLSVLFRL